MARAGRWFLVAAGLVVLFVAYQLWGTAIVHWQGQRDLRARFDHALAQARAADHGGGPHAITYPAVGDPVAIIVIPSIGLDQVVVEGVGAAQLAVGPGHYPGTALPGQPGNSGIAGHRTTHGAPFNALAALVPGDPVMLTTLQGSFTYRVTRSLVVAPDDVSVLDATVTPQLTLTTCNPKYSAAQRLVVEARLVTPAAPVTPAPGPRSGAGAVAGADQLDSSGTWIVLVASGAGLVVLVLLVGRLRRRAASGPARRVRRSRRTARWATVVAVPVGLALLFLAFGALDALLPQSF
jgi:sortase A